MFEEALREFSVDSDEGKNEIDVFAVFGRVKRFGRVTVLGGCTVGLGYNWIIHKTPLNEGMLSPKSGAKVEVLRKTVTGNW